MGVLGVQFATFGQILFSGATDLRRPVRSATGGVLIELEHTKASGRVEYPNPKCKQGTISQVPHLRIGL